MRGKRPNINPKKSRGDNNSQTNAIKVNKKTLSKMTREISSMKARLTARLKNVGKSKKACSEDKDSDVQDNAGNQFGGRKKKKQKKAGQQD
jgi:hypothetical protein